MLNIFSTNLNILGKYSDFSSKFKDIVFVVEIFLFLKNALKQFEIFVHDLK